MNKTGNQTLVLPSAPAFLACTAVVGKKEGEGPLKDCFDAIVEDSYFGQATWEKAETCMLQQCFQLCCKKAGLQPQSLNAIFSGDLLNQCISSAFSMRNFSIPYFGLYGACSTMAEALLLSAVFIDGGYAQTACAMTGSHFCTAERQYRFPLEYGGQRPSTSQWTVTGAGAAILHNGKTGVRITHVTPGKIIDSGITDANHMGAAMAPAACDTICSHLRDTGRTVADYDAIITGDLGAVGHDLLSAMLEKDGIQLGARLLDCGVLMYDLATQEVFSGGSGCGCSASVLCGHIIPAMERGVWKRVLFAGTGALLSPTSSQQGDSIPGICHAVSLEKGD